MGEDESALVRLWREKRSEIDPEDLSANLIVQLGVATEELNRHWFGRNTKRTLKDVQRRIRHPVIRWMGATLDGVVAETGAESLPCRRSSDDEHQGSSGLRSADVRFPG